MKIIKISKMETEVFHNNKYYTRLLCDNMPCWTINNTDYRKILEEKYQICLREQKLKNILDENY